MPSIAVTALPTGVAPLKIVTMLPAAAVPVSVGVVSFVIRSLEETPLSLAAVSTGADGAVGATVSMVMVVPAEAGPRLPATSVAVVVTVWSPLDMVLEVTV